jgi:DNA-binding response OmpR family regulator
MSRILVVDDEPRIVGVVRAYLEREGHEVTVAHDGEAALAAALDAPPDLVVLDVMLPGRTGFDVLRALRAEDGPGPAVILLTARDDVIDRVAGLELGADDYVTKPFEPRELVARVGAVLRRVRAAAPHGGGTTGVTAPGPAPRADVPHDAPPPLLLADLVVDPLGREVVRDGVRIDLTRSEFDLLLAFAEQPERAWTREQLGTRVHGEAFDAFDRSIDSHVKNLRAKLDPAPGGGSYVETVRGIGYRAARR